MQNYDFTVILIEIMFLFKLKNHIRKSIGGQTARGDNLRGYTGRESNPRPLDVYTERSLTTPPIPILGFYGFSYIFELTVL